MSLFGFIGAGNMGFALMKACVKSFGQNQIAYYDLFYGKMFFCKRAAKDFS